VDRVTRGHDRVELALALLEIAIEQLRSLPAAAVRPEVPAVAPDEGWLTPREESTLLRWSVKTLTRRWRTLPFCFANPRGRGYLVSRRRLAEWRRRQEGS
jgi:hypothetical protein